MLTAWSWEIRGEGVRGAVCLGEGGKGSAKEEAAPKRRENERFISRQRTAGGQGSGTADEVEMERRSASKDDHA